MSLAPSPTQSDILTALRSFLLKILPDGVEVVQGQDNKVPEPKGNDFVTMTPIMQSRLSTNVDTYADVSFTASIADTEMTVTAIEFGQIAVGQVVFGVGVAALTKVNALGTGTGGVGTYTVSPAQDVPSRKMSSGSEIFLQPTKVTVQLDVHGPASAENSQTISTLFRDDYAVQAFKASGFDVTPLYVSDPRQLPFTNENQQVENRYVIDAVMQANQIIRAPQQFADELDVDLIDVQSEFHA